MSLEFEKGQKVFNSWNKKYYIVSYRDGKFYHVRDYRGDWGYFCYVDLRVASEEEYSTSLIVEG
jgi:hypothetical protein